MTENARKSTWRELRALLRLPGFRKLFAVRLVSQTADGMFQVGLATLLFFSPEAMNTAAGVAAGFAVMLAPFTLVGPFAGVLLDRWSRRQILFLGNLIRALLTFAMAAAYVWHNGFALVYVLGLAALSINRFLLAGLSAGLPKLIGDDYHSPAETNDISNLLLTANSLVPTLGAGAAFLGGAVGLGLAATSTVFGSAIVIFGSACTMMIASLITTRLTRWQLGPEKIPEESLRQGLLRVTKDFAGAAKYLTARLTPGQGLAVTAIHRFLYGLVFIAAILMSRNILAANPYPYLEPSNYVDVAGTGMVAGLGSFAIIMGLIGAGGAISVVITPLLSRQLGPQRWVAVMFLVAAAAMLILSLAPIQLVVFSAALILGIGSQGSKIAIDTIVQTDTADQYRGRAFAFYDVIFNAAFVAAAVFAAVIIPDSGWSRPLFLGIAAAYILTAIWMYFRSAKSPAVVPISD